MTKLQSKIENRKSKIKNQFNRWAILALLLSVFAWAALLSPYYFTGAHDGRHSLFYQLQFTQNVADGQWFPRWGPDFGFGRGYPLFIFYAPMTSYIVQAVKAWGVGGLVASVKVSWLLAFLVGAAGIFRLAKSWWRDDRAAFVAALVYTFVPYKLLDIYVRASLAEFWALALFPWIMLGFKALVRRPGAMTLATAAFLYAGLMLTHTATTLLFSAFLGAYILFELALGFYEFSDQRTSYQREGTNWDTSELWKPVLAVAGALALGLMNAAIFWLPLLAERGNIDLGQYVPENYNVANQFIQWSQFLSPFWGFGFAIPGPNDGMSFQLGLLPLLMTLLAIWLLLRQSFERIRSAYLIWALISLALVVFAMTSFTALIWQSFPLAAMVQFPWRLLGISAVLLALIAGGTTVGLLACLPDAKGLHPAVGLLALLVLYGSSHYTMPRFTPPSEREETLLTIIDFQRDYPDMAGRLPPTEVVPQSSLMEAQYEALEPPEKFRLLAGVATIQQTYYGAATVKADISVEQSAQIELMTYDYPGWTLYLNQEQYPHQTLAPEGTIAFELVPGKYQIEAHFEQTPLRRAASLISLAGWALSLLLMVYAFRQDK